MNWSELYWQRITPLHLFLWPVSLLFALFQLIRRVLYHRAVLPSVHLPIPVIVIDSLTAGSATKADLVLWIVKFLKAFGLRPGIIGRGYPDNYRPPMAVTIDSNVNLTGSKSLLLALYIDGACPVWIGYDRIAVANALLKAHPECNVIICDDGLQDLRLHRDFEIVVVDTNTLNFGNGLTMPAGPLKDNFARLEHSDAVVLAGNIRRAPDLGEQTRLFQINPAEEYFVNLAHPTRISRADGFDGKRIHAITSGPDTQTFLDNLKFLRLATTPHTFPSGHPFVKENFELDDAEIILMPEEDAVKCLDMHDERIWVLQQENMVDLGLRDVILEKLREKFMDPKLLDILVCPLCKGPLIYKKDKQELICKPDRLAYPIKDGIPVMLEDEARQLSPEEKIE
ncbi:tetraacyldisaccharide 4'-kinase [Nitrosomonas halophila]|uniref:Multifunctional fusion protein n=2 Tax=Nitrosomonas halophila TaxID=44576 RepID=A0A1H3ETG0_9PROT|nr:tetraacyldisaccharide 4'-kinase [Nitrosomonas halophila]